MDSLSILKTVVSLIKDGMTYLGSMRNNSHSAGAPSLRRELHKRLDDKLREAEHNPHTRFSLKELLSDLSPWTQLRPDKKMQALLYGVLHAEAHALLTDRALDISNAQQCEDRIKRAAHRIASGDSVGCSASNKGVSANLCERARKQLETLGIELKQFMETNPEANRGIAPRKLTDGLCSPEAAKLRCLVPPHYIIEAILLTHLNIEYGLKCTLDFSTVSFSDYTDRLERVGDTHPYDLCIGVDTAASRALAGQTNPTYVCTDLASQLRHGILSSRLRHLVPGAVESARVTVPLGPYSSSIPSAMALKQDLVLNPTLDLEQVAVERQHEIMRESDPDILLISWSPYWQVFSAAGLGWITRGSLISDTPGENLILIRDELYYQQKLVFDVGLRALARRGLYDLQQNHISRAKAIDALLANRDFCYAVTQYSGIQPEDLA